MEASSGKLLEKSKEDLYGILDRPNIGSISYGPYEFESWYGNAAYFNPKISHQSLLGYESYDNASLEHNLSLLKRNTNKERSDDISGQDKGYWLEKLYVCRYCFKYSSFHHLLKQHEIVCPHNRRYPLIGRLVYRDDKNGIFIKKVQGHKHKLFCQCMCLFSKLFLDDKSIYYAVDTFDFYVVYGRCDDVSQGASDTPQYIPNGFFSKEKVPWDPSNNLACICVFPPFQRRSLGSLMIELLYYLANTVDRLPASGPEFPLSKFGKICYLRFWSKKLAAIILTELLSVSAFDLTSLSDLTGFRKEDILLTLEYMGVSYTQEHSGKTSLHLKALENWCINNKVDRGNVKGHLVETCLLV